MESTEKIKLLIDEVNQFATTSKEDFENFKIRFTSKKGELAQLFSAMKDIDPSSRREFGQKVNELKNIVEEKLKDIMNFFETAADSTKSDEDLTLPGEPIESGSLHPISIIRDRICRIFERAGYAIAEGPEIEDDWHNFTALNFPEEHPARDMQDTFFVKVSDNYPGEAQRNDWALRTHTSSVQVRVMENNKPPVRIIAPGRVYRNEAISARAHCFFHQVEGLYIDEGVSFADMKQTLLYFAREMFGSDTKIRLRASYFPFTEPSAEMDITCFLCGGKGCNVCKYTGWVEILGCGMVDPAVLDNCNIDSKRYSGFAFGMGIERITMLKYGVRDLRIFSENDLRFLKQFRGVV